MANLNEAALRLLTAPFVAGGGLLVMSTGVYFTLDGFEESILPGIVSVTVKFLPPLVPGPRPL